MSLGYGGFEATCKAAIAAIGILAGTAEITEAQETKISVLGDSLVAGYGLPPTAGLVPQLQMWLDARKAEITLQNAGVSGDTTFGGLARLDWTLGPDVDGLVISLGANDMLRGLSPSDAKANLTAILEGATSRGLPVLLVGFQAPLNWGPDYKREFDGMYPKLAQQFETVFLPSFFSSFVDPETGIVEIKYLQQDRLHPNSDGIAVLVDSLGPYFLELAELAKKAGQP